MKKKKARIPDGEYIPEALLGVSRRKLVAKVVLDRLLSGEKQP